MSEPWIRVHANLHGKPIVWRAVDALHVSQHEAIGLLVQFWGGVSQHASNGHVADLPDAQLEAWAGWRGKRGRFAAFIRSTHLDADGRVNEWDEYAGALEHRRSKERDRLRNKRTVLRNSTHDVAQQDAYSTHDVATRARERNDTIRELLIDDDGGAAVNGSAIGEPALTALYLTIWANGAITERWGEQPAPLVPGGSHELADHLAGLGAAWELVRDSIYRQCRESRLARPPRSVNYFRAGIEHDVAVADAKAVMAASGEQPPPAVPRPGIAARAFASTLKAIEDIP